MNKSKSEGKRPPKSKNKEAVFSVRLSSDVDERLQACAAKLDLSKNDIARHAIRAAIDSIEANNYRVVWPITMRIINPETSL